MNDNAIYQAAVEDPKVTLQIGSSRFGRYIKNIKNPDGKPIDLYTNMINSAQHERDWKNPNLLGFEKAIRSYKGHIPDYYIEVPLAYKDPDLFLKLYEKRFQGKDLENARRGFGRLDIYIPEYGAAIELDSKTFHREGIEVPLDEAKENMILEFYNIKTVHRLNFASRDPDEIKKATAKLHNYLNTAKPVRPIEDFMGIVESWKLYNREILPFFPYIETITGDYYCEHSKLYSLRDVILDTSTLPENLKAKIMKENIKKPLMEVYKKIKNINLQII